MDFATHLENASVIALGDYYSDMWIWGGDEKTALEIKNLVRGLNPIMGAYTFLNDKKLKLWKVNVIDFKEFSSKYNIDT